MDKSSKQNDLLYMLNLINVAVDNKYTYKPICNILKDLFETYTIDYFEIDKQTETTIKTILVNLIIDKNVKELVDIYNKIFDTSIEILVDSDNSDNELEEIKKEKITCPKDLLKKMEDEAIKNRKFNFNKKINTKFKLNEIVGARDINGRWWLSRILHIFIDPSGPIWYYVHFENWSDEQNEWIREGNKIAIFNPFKHKLRRTSEL